jgi:hypothetical protein
MGKTHLFEAKPEFVKPIERLRLFVRVRVQGARVDSVPLKRLVELSNCGFRNWRVEKAENGLWLILEAF